MAFLFTAHNEAAFIGRSVVTARRAAPDVPIFVVADRCTDSTADLARTAGARVRERRDGPSGKAAALAWFIGTAASDLAGIEGLLVLDADSRVRPGAVEALARALAPGAAAAQAFVYSPVVGGSPASILASYSEWLSQTIDDRLRKLLRWPVPLRGTGMALRLSVFREIAPALRTQVEDAELTLLLASRRCRIAFVPEAVVEDPKPDGTARFVRQRARWLQGQRQLWKFYWPTMIRLFLTGGIGVWWLLSTLLLKPRTLFIPVKVVGLAALAILSSHPAARFVSTLIGLSVMLDICRYLVGLAIVPTRWRSPVVWAMVRTPAYAAMWARSLVLSLTSREAWLRVRD